MDSIKQLLINYYIKGLWSPFIYAKRSYHLPCFYFTLQVGTDKQGSKKSITLMEHRVSGELARRLWSTVAGTV